MTTDLRHDQAEGLRRIFSGPRSRLITLVSTLPPAEKHAMLVNLTAALSRTGNDVLLVDARTGNTGIASHLGHSAALTLDDAVIQDSAPEKALQHAREGFNIMRLFAGDAIREPIKLASAFDNIQKQAQVILIDGEPNTDGTLPLKAMEEGMLLLQLAATAECITSAYTLIKHLHNHLGRRQFDIVVSGANEKKADIVSMNLATTAKRHLAVALNCVGSVPIDPHLAQATRLGKAVTDVFPMADASIAYKRIADYILSN
jgi:flagellar biosynthesis protein FlhG